MWAWPWTFASARAVRQSQWELLRRQSFLLRQAWHEKSHPAHSQVAALIIASLTFIGCCVGSALIIGGAALFSGGFPR
jgi:hypothetical protein